MQTPNIQIPSLNAEALSAPKGKLNLSGSGTDNLFKQALSREMDQRQAKAGDAKAPAKNAERPAPAASRSSAPKQAAPAKPVQQQQNTKADATEQVKPAAAATEAPAAPVPAKTASSDSDKDSGATDAQAAQAADPLADMLALVAAYNQPPPASAPVADTTDAAIASASTAGASAAILAADAATDQGAAAQAAGAAAIAANAAEPDAPTMVLVGPLTVGPPPSAKDGEDASTVAAFKDALGQAGSAAQSAGAAAAVADAAAKTAKTAPGTGSLTPVPGAAPPGVANVKPTAALLGDKPIEATATDIDVSLQTGTDVINRIETKAAPADDSQPQLAQTRQQPTEPLTAAAAIKTTTTTDADFAAALKEAAPAAIAPTAAKAAQEIAKAAGAVPTDKLNSRVGTPGWDQQLGQKIIFMAAGGEHSATMELNPPDLGPLQVVLSVNKDQATAAFSSAAPEVRQALEAALPRLKEMMAEAGIQLGSATVSAGMSDQNNGFNQQAASAQAGNGNGGNGGNRGGGRFGNDGGDHSAEAQRAAAPPRRVPAGAVDTFA